MYVAIPLLMASMSAGTGPIWVGVLGTLVTAIVTIIGWFYVRWKEDRQRAIERELKRRERQIEEFYGPVFSLVHQIRRASAVQDNFIEHLGITYKEESDKKEQEVRYWFRETFFSPLHNEMLQILKGRLYLVEAAEVPTFKRYLEHAIDDRARTELREFPKDHFVWPEDLQEHVSSGLETAVQERDKILLRQRKATGFGRTEGNA